MSEYETKGNVAYLAFMLLVCAIVGALFIEDMKDRIDRLEVKVISLQKTLLRNSLP